MWAFLASLDTESNFLYFKVFVLFHNMPNASEVGPTHGFQLDF
jgi:hypothetical protein